MSENQRQALRAIFQAAIKAVDPAEAVRRAVSLEGGLLRIHGEDFPLPPNGRIIVAAAGKGAASMAKALEDILGDHLDQGVAAVAKGTTLDRTRFRQFEPAHPEPDQEGHDAAMAIRELVASCGPDDLIIAALSGGASAMTPLPPSPLALDHVVAATRLLLDGGADIFEVNTVRKHLSGLSGGRLAKAANGTRIAVLVISDVVGNDLSAIGSGPFYPDTGTFSDCLEIIRRHELEQDMPRAVVDYLNDGAKGRHAESPRPGDPCFENVSHFILADNAMALRGGFHQARKLGYNAVVLDARLMGEARLSGKRFGSLAHNILRQLEPAAPPACILLGGETWVRVSGHGFGGRCQEMALSAAIELEDAPAAALLCAGSDGIDGRTHAAGAFVDGDTMPRAREMGLDPEDYLDRNDSHMFFKALDDLMVTGPTGTNVMDLAILLVDHISGQDQATAAGSDSRPNGGRHG